MRKIWRAAMVGLCLAAVTSGARAADWDCTGETVDVPGTMTVVLTVDEAGRPKTVTASLLLGASSLPRVSVGYRMADPNSPLLSGVESLIVGAMVEADPPPRAKTAMILLVIDRGVWARPWNLYAQWRSGEAGLSSDFEVVAFTGVIPFETERSGIGAALNGGQRLAVSIEGDDDKVLGRREFALAPPREIQAMAEIAHARALEAAADPRENCEPAMS